MNVEFNKPRYAIPLILLPFICIFFYVYKTSIGKEQNPQAGEDSLQTELAEVSDQVRNRSLTDKLDAYRNQYKQADGYTAIGHIQEEQILNEKPITLYNQHERHLLDSLDRAVKGTFSSRTDGFPNAIRKPSTYMDDPHERALQQAIQEISMPKKQINSIQKHEPEPMELFRQQLALIDSMGKANDPEYKATQQKNIEKELFEIKLQQRLSVTKTSQNSSVFNTVKPDQEETFITAIVDQNIKGYVGSRLRIRLLDDMLAGKFLIKKGSYIYAEISGFSGQRVNLTISSIIKGQHILPVKLVVYDQDGLPGLYVPASAFREFTKDLGGTASQGMTLQQAAENNSQLVMSILQKMFQSTTGAVNKMIRQNKAKIKYNTRIYLIDPEQLRDNQNNYLEHH